MLNIAVIGVAAETEQISEWIKRYCDLFKISSSIMQLGRAEEIFNNTAMPEVVFICTGGAEGFLDARRIRDADKACRIVFADDTDEYVIKGIRLHFTDFIVRPVEFRHVVRAMKLCGVGDIL